MCPKCDGKGTISVKIYWADPVEEAVQLWRQGRYYRQNDAVFISAPIDLRDLRRGLSYPNQIKDPYGHKRWSSDAVMKEQVTELMEQVYGYPRLKIIGLSWSGYTHGIRDHKGVDKPLLQSQLELSVELKDMDGRWVQVAGPFLDVDSGWAPVVIALPRLYPQIRYRVRFNTRCDPLNAILLETPIFDDITLYYTVGPVYYNWKESY